MTGPDQFTSLITHIRKFIPLKDDEIPAIVSALRHKKVKKKELLLREQEVCSANYFVIHGCLRMYFIREDGVEKITQFAIENWWLTDFQSLDWRQPSRFHIQAVEATGLAILDRDAFTGLCDRLPLVDRPPAGPLAPSALGPVRLPSRRPTRLRRHPTKPLLHLFFHRPSDRWRPSDLGACPTYADLPPASPSSPNASPSTWWPPISASPPNSSARSKPAATRVDSEQFCSISRHLQTFATTIDL